MAVTFSRSCFAPAPYPRLALATDIRVHVQSGIIRIPSTGTAIRPIAPIPTCQQSGQANNVKAAVFIPRGRGKRQGGENFKKKISTRSVINHAPCAVFKDNVFKGTVFRVVRLPSNAAPRPPPAAARRIHGQTRSIRSPTPRTAIRAKTPTTARQQSIASVGRAFVSVSGP